MGHRGENTNMVTGLSFFREIFWTELKHKGLKLAQLIREGIKTMASKGKHF